MHLITELMFFLGITWFLCGPYLLLHLCVCADSFPSPHCLLPVRISTGDFSYPQLLLAISLEIITSFMGIL